MKWYDSDLIEFTACWTQSSLEYSMRLSLFMCWFCLKTSDLLLVTFLTPNVLGVIPHTHQFSSSPDSNNCCTIQFSSGTNPAKLPQTRRLSAQSHSTACCVRRQLQIAGLLCFWPTGYNWRVPTIPFLSWIICLNLSQNSERYFIVFYLSLAYDFMIKDKKGTVKWRGRQDRVQKDPVYRSCCACGVWGAFPSWCMDVFSHLKALRTPLFRCFDGSLFT